MKQRQVGVGVLGILGGIGLSMAADTGVLDKNPVVHIQAQAEALLVPETLVATLSVEAADTEVGVAQRRVNDRLMQIQQRGKTDAIQVRTLNYQTLPSYTHANSKRPTWRATALVELRSTQPEMLSSALGALGEYAAIGQLRFELTAAQKDTAQALATRDAIQAFKAKAQGVADEFGYRGAKPVEVRIHPNEGVMPYMGQRAMMLNAEGGDTSVPVEPGQQKVVVTIEGSVMLTP